MFEDCCLAIKQSQEQKNKHYLLNEYNSYFKKEQTIKNQSKNKQMPFKFKFIDILGLKNILIQKFIFARKNNCNYRMKIKNKIKCFEFIQTKFTQIEGYQQKCHIIDLQNHFIPLIYFKRMKSSIRNQDNKQNQNQNEQKKEKDKKLTIIYSHGNSSNLQDSYKFITGLIDKFPYDFIIYDYTGYGNQAGIQKYKYRFQKEKHQLSDRSISQDLKVVVNWSKIDTTQMILWGFSLGCYPTISVAAQIQFNSIILMSPFSSIYSLVQDMKSHQQNFEGDIFNNLKLIEHVKSDILLLHSSDDQIIPIDQSYLLIRRFYSYPRYFTLKFLQLVKISHNDIHQYFITKQKNKLQDQIKEYLIDRLKKNKIISEELENQQQQQNKQQYSNNTKQQLSEEYNTEVKLKRQGSKMNRGLLVTSVNNKVSLQFNKY